MAATDTIAQLQAENLSRRVTRFTRDELLHLIDELKRAFPDRPPGRPPKGETKPPQEPERVKARYLLRRYRWIVRQIDNGKIHPIVVGQAQAQAQAQA